MKFGLHNTRSNGFIDHQVRTLRTVLSTTQDSRKTLEDMLLDLQSSHGEGNTTSPSHSKQSQKMHFDQAYAAREFEEQGPSQEVLF